MKRKEYEKELRKLEVELCALQGWVKEKGLRVVVNFEGRDAAGKGGTIKAITSASVPRVPASWRFRASDREKSQLYMQRYFTHFPAAGEIMIFDRSWYNRAGVEYVMGLCTPEEHSRFLKVCPSSNCTPSMKASCSSSIGSRSAMRSKSVASRPASKIRCGNGN